VTAGARRREVRATPHLVARLRAGTDIAYRCASGLSRDVLNDTLLFSPGRRAVPASRPPGV